MEDVVLMVSDMDDVTETVNEIDDVKLMVGVLDAEMEADGVTLAVQLGDTEFDGVVVGVCVSLREDVGVLETERVGEVESLIDFESEREEVLDRVTEMDFVSVPVVDVDLVSLMVTEIDFVSLIVTDIDLVKLLDGDCDSEAVFVVLAEAACAGSGRVTRRTTTSAAATAYGTPHCKGRQITELSCPSCSCHRCQENHASYDNTHLSAGVLRACAIGDVCNPLYTRRRMTRCMQHLDAPRNPAGSCTGPDTELLYFCG